MVRKINATLDDVAEARANLEAQIQATKADVEKASEARVTSSYQKLLAEVGGVRDHVKDLDKRKVDAETCQKVAHEAKADVARSAGELRQQIEALRPVIAESISRARTDLERKIADTDANARSAFAEELEMLCARFDQEMASLRGSLEALIGHRAAEAADALQKERQGRDEAVAQARQETAAAIADLQKTAADELQRAVEEQDKADKKRELKAKSVQSDNEIKFMEMDSKMQKHADEAAVALQETLAKVAVELKEHSASAARRFDGVDDQLERLWAAFSDVQNVPTRKVDWVIRGAAQRLKLPRVDDGEDPAPYVSWTSPLFDAAGASGLTLEFRLFRPSNSPAEDDRRGDCAVLLRAPKGTHIAFRLSIGSVSETFEHKFTSDKPMGTQRLCFLAQHIDDLTGTLRTGVEILECIYQFDRSAIEDKAVQDDGQPPPLDTFFQCQRHVNNRVLDQVKLQIDYFRTRMTRRIEWRLEQASLMKRSFPRGAPMCSKEFDAAGIENMQILFYPSGYDGAGEGFCSAYLTAPAGVTLKSWLQVGSERREINHTFDKAGQLGRANFCRFENCVAEEDDTVLIVFEIQEAHVDLVARMNHPPPPQVGIRSFAREASALVPFGSTVKLQRTTDQLPPALQEVKVLPSLWTAKNSHELAVKVDGLRPIKDARAWGRPRTGSRRSPSSPLLH